MSLNMRYVPYGEYGAHYELWVDLGGPAASCEVSGSPEPWDEPADGSMPDGRCHATCHLLREGARLGRGAVLVCDDECGSYAEAAALLESVVGRAAAGEFDHLLASE